jgi:hypothetical protein
MTSSLKEGLRINDMMMMMVMVMVMLMVVVIRRRILNKVAQTVRLPTFIREVLSSNLGLVTDCLDRIFMIFLFPLQANARTVHKSRPQPSFHILSDPLVSPVETHTLCAWF